MTGQSLSHAVERAAALLARDVLATHGPAYGAVIARRGELSTRQAAG